MIRTPVVVAAVLMVAFACEESGSANGEDGGPRDGETDAPSDDENDDTGADSDTGTETDTDTDEVPAPTDPILQPDSTLVWMRCPLGWTLDGEDCRIECSWMVWEDALTACPDGWRLPTRKEFIDLLKDCDEDVLAGEWGSCNSCSESSACASMFSVTVGYFWSSTEEDINNAWVSDWYDDSPLGAIHHTSKDSDAFVRCVRGLSQEEKGMGR